MINTPDPRKRSGIVARAAMLITLAYAVALLCAATPINSLKLQGDANANGNSLTNAATISATNGYFNNLTATNGITGPMATTNLVGMVTNNVSAASVTSALFTGNASALTNFPGTSTMGLGALATSNSITTSNISNLGAGVASGLTSTMNGTGSLVGSSNATLTTPQASTYPITYLFSSFVNGDSSGPKTFCSTDTINLNSIGKANGVDIYTPSVNFRDPRILKIGNTYYLSYTAGTSGTNYIGLAYSTDLINWTTVTTPNWSAYFTASENSIWNGCWYFDGTNYWLYFAGAYSNGASSLATPYIVQFMPNGSSSTFGTPTAITFNNTRSYADIMSVNEVSGTYYGLVQDFGTGGGQYVETWASPALSGTNYTLTTTNDSDGFGSAVESGAQVQLPNGNWKTYVVMYGGGYLYSSTNTSLTTNTWSSPVTVSNFSTANANTEVDWIDVVPFSDIQTQQCEVNLLAAGGSNVVSAVETTTVTNNLFVNGDLAVTSLGFLQYNNIGYILQPGLSSGNYQTFDYGVANSTGNSESFGYSYNGSGNANNEFWLAQYGEPVTFVQWKNGDLSLGPGATADPGVPLWINGNVTTTGNISLTGSINTSLHQTSVNGSTAGTAVCSMPFQGTSYKKVMVFLGSFNGTGTYTFPIAFTSTNDLIVGGSLSSDATVTTTQVGITTATNSTGSITIEGY